MSNNEDSYNVIMTNLDPEFNLSHNKRYEILQIDEIKQIREEQIKDFIAFSNLSHDEAEIALIKTNWNDKLLKSKWFDNIALNKVNISIEESLEASLQLKAKRNSQKCLLCSKILTHDTTIHLKCEHNFCIPCFTEYLIQRMDEPKKAITSNCPLNQCNIIIPYSIIFKCLESNYHNFQQYCHFIIQNYIESLETIKICPNPNCGVYIRVYGSAFQEIKCQCGYIFCFNCLNESHKPCNCQMIKDLVKKKDKNSFKIIECPLCQKVLENNQNKNNICYLMSCDKCGYNFCSICLLEWKKHETKSNCLLQFRKENNLDNFLTEKDIDLNRLESNFEKFLLYHRAQNSVINLSKQIELYKEELMIKYSIPELELQFLDDSLQTLVNSRKILKYSFIFDCYQKNISKNVRYENNRHLLISSIDKLSDIMEKAQINELLNIQDYSEFNNSFFNFRWNVILLIVNIKKEKETFLQMCHS